VGVCGHHKIKDIQSLRPSYREASCVDPPTKLRRRQEKPLVEKMSRRSRALQYEKQSLCVVATREKVCRVSLLSKALSLLGKLGLD
jgi:hypothetical protein